MLRQQMLSKQALAQFPVLRQQAGCLLQGMHPGNAPGNIRVFDAVASLGVVLHDLAGAASAFLVYLEEDGSPGLGDADAVLIDEAFNDERVKEGTQEGNQVRVVIEADAALDNVVRDGAEILRLRLVQPGGAFFPPVLAGLPVRMVSKKLLGSVVIVAGGVVVAFAHTLVQDIAILIHIAGEAAGPAALGAGVP